MILTWEKLVKAACNNKLMISTVESCTGGMISSSITDVPGASKCFIGGIVTYSNDLKISLAGVTEQTLIDHGAVSPETAREMADGFLILSCADITASVTGIAGPAGGTEEKPVGTVYIGMATKDGKTHVEGFLLEDLSRSEFKKEVSNRVLSMLQATIDSM